MGLLNTRSIAAILIVVALSLGCSTRLDRHWGESQHAVTALQIAHPNPAEADPTMDGVSAERAIESGRGVEAAAAGSPPKLIQSGSGSGS